MIESTIDDNNDQSEPYIPLSRAEVIALCQTMLADPLKPQFMRLTEILSAWYHFAFHADLERLKESFEQNSAAFGNELDGVVRAANFTKIEQSDLNKALREESVFRLRLEVNFSDFDEIVFYRRGASMRSAEIPKWFGLSKRNITFNNFDQVLVYVRFKNVAADETRKLPFVPGSSMLKLFVNVPEADLEMLFPNTEVRMRLMDKMFIGVPAFVSGVVVLSTKIGGTLLLVMGLLTFWIGVSKEPVELDQAALIGLMSAAGALTAYLWKQYSNFKNRKIRFMKALTENLYFKTLANDGGVLSYLIDRAEESETKEVLLGYAQLVASGPMTAGELAGALQAHMGPGVTFDLTDALRKLEGLRLVQVKDELITPIPLEQANEVIDAKWDRAFGPG